MQQHGHQQQQQQQPTVEAGKKIGDGENNDTSENEEFDDEVYIFDIANESEDEVDPVNSVGHNEGKVKM